MLSRQRRAASRSSFRDDQIIAFETDRDGVGCSAHMGWATELVLRIVADRPGIAFSTLAGEVMEQVPVRTTHLNKIAAANRSWVATVRPCEWQENPEPRDKALGRRGAGKIGAPAAKATSSGVHVRDAQHPPLASWRRRLRPRPRAERALRPRCGPDRGCSG